MKRTPTRATALSLLLLAAGCGARAADPEGTSEITGHAQAALTGSAYYYLRCNNTDWGVDEGSRLQATSDPSLLSIAVHVHTTSDSCSLTQVTATAPDSWGSGQRYFWATKTLVVPASATLTSGANQTTFGVTYPSTGSFMATFDVVHGALTVAPAGAIEGRVSQAPAGFGLTGTTVKLLGPSGATLATTLTDSNGAYQFPNLAPATYSVAFAAGTASVQPTYSVTGSPATVAGGPVSVDATCTPGSQAPCTAGPTVDDPLHRLVFVDPAITDPAQDPAASDATDGHFSFRYVLETLSGCPDAGANAACVTTFVNSFFGNVSSSYTVNGRVANHLNFEVLLQNWPKLADGQTLDMTQTPFAPIAIVNRTDVHVTGQGEARIVFGQKTRSAGTIIAEFALPSTATLPTRASWVNAFYTLPVTESHAAAIACQSSTNPSCQFIYDLQTLTDTFVTPSQLLDVRINVFADGSSPVWTWQQLTLATAPGQNTLVRAPMTDTPPADLNGDATLGSYIAANGPGIRSGFLSLPASFLGGEAVDAIASPWSFSQLDAATLHDFSGRTCNGCHIFESSDPANPSASPPAFHVDPRVVPTGDGSNVLSGFMRNIEIPRRESFMSHRLACGSGPCGPGAEIPMMQPQIIGM